MKEMPAEYYDAKYSDWKMHLKPYWKTNMAYRFAVASAMIRRHFGDNGLRILDIGCGTGQFGHHLYDLGYRRYTGFDFSKVAIIYAKHLWDLPFEFFCADAFDPKVYDRRYDVAVCFSVLEHVEQDLELLGMISPGKSFVGIVPDYIVRSHVRCFKQEREVKMRYKALMRILDIKFIYRQWVFAGIMK